MQLRKICHHIYKNSKRKVRSRDNKKSEALEKSLSV